MKKIKSFLQDFLPPKVGEDLTPNPKRFSSGSLHFVRLVEHWPGIVGEFLGAQSRPFRLKKNQLWVAVLNPSMATEMSYLQEDLIQKIKKAYPPLAKEIKELVVRVHPSLDLSISSNTTASPKKGELQQAQKKSSAFHPLDPRYRLARAKAEAELGGLKDDSLRELLISIWIQNSFLKDEN